MKTRINPIAVLTAFVVSFVLAGCGGQKKTKMDTTSFDKAYASAPAEVKSETAKASKAFKDGKFIEAANILNAVVGKNPATSEQKDAIIDVITKAQKIMSEDADKADINAQQAIEVLMATMQGRPAIKVGVNPSALDPTK
jgi:cytochrome c-type biogenesis protein CcmH/NrfG